MFYGEEWQFFEESFLVELSHENQLHNYRHWDRTYVIIYNQSLY